MPTTKTDWFAYWFNSPYYHLLYSHRNEQEASQFIQKLFEKLSLEPGALCLDLACGKGRHAKTMAELGHKVVGLDISPDSIAAANAMQIPNTRFFVHDMRTPWGNLNLHLVSNLFTSFGYFDTDAENIKVMENIYQSLMPGGYFIQDYLNPASVLNTLPFSEKIEKNGVLFNIQKEASTTHIHKYIEVLDKPQEVHFSVTEKVRIISATQLQAWHAQAGFEIVKVYGDYQLNSATADAPRSILISQKK